MTNNKIKMAQKGGTNVPNPMNDLLKASQEHDFAGIISSIMAMEDTDFENIEPSLKASFEKTFNSPAYTNHVKQQLSFMTELDYKKEKAGYDGMVEAINELDMSETKKSFLKYLFDNSYRSMLMYYEDPSEHIQVTYRKLTPDALIPTYAHKGDAGADIYALVNDHITIPPGGTALIPTGIALKIPGGYEAQVRPRSGMSLKTKIRVSNAPGTIDSNYRGEIGVILDNRGNAPYIVQKGDKIAQLVFNKVPTADFIEGEVDTEEINTRGENGFGSTGTNVTNINNE